MVVGEVRNEARRTCMRGNRDERRKLEEGNVKERIGKRSGIERTKMRIE